MARPMINPVSGVNCACRNGGHRVLRWRGEVKTDREKMCNFGLAAMEAIEFFDGEVTPNR